MKNSASFEEWIKLAESDLDYAGYGIKQKAHYHIACFHCQQAAEKALKAFLSARNIRFPKVHSVEKLIKDCAKTDKDFLAEQDKAKRLDAFYIETRYSGAAFEAFTEKEAREALEIAQEILEKVKNKVK